MKHKKTHIEHKAERLWRGFTAKSDEEFWEKYQKLIIKGKRQYGKNHLYQDSQKFSVTSTSSINRHKKQSKRYTFYPENVYEYLWKKFLGVAAIAVVPVVLIAHLDFPAQLPWLIAIIIVFGSGIAFYLSTITSFRITKTYFVFTRTFFFDKSTLLLRDIDDMTIIKRSFTNESGEPEHLYELMVKVLGRGHYFHYGLKRASHKRFKEILLRNNIKLEDKNYW